MVSYGLPQLWFTLETITCQIRSRQGLSLNGSTFYCLQLCLQGQHFLFSSTMLFEGVESQNYFFKILLREDFNYDIKT